MKRTIAMALVGLVAMASATGCAGLGGPSEEERVMSRVQSWSDAMMEQDVDAMMAIFADTFRHPEAGGKEQVRLLLEMAIAQGYLDDAEASLADMEIRVSEDGRTASAAPIVLSGPPGEIALRADFTKGGDGQWYLTSTDLI